MQVVTVNSPVLSKNHMAKICRKRTKSTKGRKGRQIVHGVRFVLGKRTKRTKTYRYWHSKLL